MQDILPQAPRARPRTFKGVESKISITVLIEFTLDLMLSAPQNDDLQLSTRSHTTSRFENFNKTKATLDLMSSVEYG